MCGPAIFAPSNHLSMCVADPVSGRFVGDPCTKGMATGCQAVHSAVGYRSSTGDALGKGRATGPRKGLVVAGLGLTQILAFGSSLYLPAVLSRPIADSTGWALPWVVGGLSLGLLTAGLVSPTIGRTIDRRGGRMVLSFSSVFFAIGLAGLGLAPSLSAYLAAWVAIGAGMGAGLYDAAFSTLGHLYGRDARSAITKLTLWGGFASTVCWPLSAYLVETIGWRGACGVYAALHLVVALPIHLFVVPAFAAKTPGNDREQGPVAEATRPLLGLRDNVPAIVLLAGVITLSGVIASVVSVHLLDLLQAHGLDLAAAVALGALIGPSQVAARFGEMAFGKRYHPLWTMIASTVLMAAGLLLLMSPGYAIAAVALATYGGGNGIGSIAKGTVPLALFGPAQYATLMGGIARPSLIAQAVAPSLAAVLVGVDGVSALLPVLAGLALANVCLVGLLAARTMRRTPQH